MRKAIITTAVLVAAPATAQTSLEFARMGHTMWAAFECSQFAVLSDQAEEHERLFLVGYDNGIAFMNALRNEEIKGQDIESIVPLGVMFRVHGPSNDFALGTIYEAATQSISDEWAESDYSEHFLENGYRERNCASTK